MDVPECNGRSDVHLGIKFNILSELRGDNLSMALSGFGTLPGQRNINGLNRGLSSGAYPGRIRLVVFKDRGGHGAVPFQYGNQSCRQSLRHRGHPGNWPTLQNEFIYRGGAEMAVHRANSRNRGT